MLTHINIKLMKHDIMLILNLLSQFNIQNT